MKTSIFSLIMSAGCLLVSSAMALENGRPGPGPIAFFNCVKTDGGLRLTKKFVDKTSVALPVILNSGENFKLFIAGNLQNYSVTELVSTNGAEYAFFKKYCDGMNAWTTNPDKEFRALQCLPYSRDGKSGVRLAGYKIEDFKIEAKDARVRRGETGSAPYSASMNLNSIFEARIPFGSASYSGALEICKTVGALEYTTIRSLRLANQEAQAEGYESPPEDSIFIEQ